MKLTAESTVLDDKKIGDSFATLQVEADGIRTEVGTKVGNNEVISRINQTAESVKIQANKIQIDGVITAINDNTTTTIDGDKIATGTLSASAVNATSGTFNEANIPNLNASKITAGTLSADRIEATSISLGKLDANAQNTIAGAATTATSYITDIGSDGVRVHDSHTSNNSVVINSDGMEVFKGGTEAANSVAKYSDSVRIGKPSGASRIELDYHSLQLIDKEGDAYLHVSDLRNEQGLASVQDEFIGDGSKKTFELSLTPITSSITVKVNGTTVTAFTVASPYLTFTTAPANNAKIVVSYQTTSAETKVFTFGSRRSGNVGAESIAMGRGNTATANHSVAIGYYNDATGNWAFAEGINAVASGSYSHAEGGDTIASSNGAHAEGDTTTASGVNSHAEGCHTTASGNYSHAGGYYTKAKGHYQTAIGKYNVEDTTSLFIIGKGTSSTPANAFAVSNTGQVFVNGTSVHSSDRRLKEHIAYIEDEAIDFIDSLKPAHYTKDGEHHVGFYAQDVEEADKWGCMVGEMNGYMTLGYMELIAPLVAYVQRLEKRIEELERTNK